ncbi:ABC transporter permease [Aquihabitans sp. G128]|uniref:ABC transporter permease n=1 Tax=Aquihabitans sp. G128 TaxID=2849779 RepID=UPI001C21529B|nr:ABC transporter permease [Aquihabitans sp. G128]QXC62820.1 ABC transporter permease [Aquihabitans sp. G128]
MSTPAQVYAYRTLIVNLAQRDLKARYKRSILGWLWSLINPASTLGIYTVVFGVILKGVAPTMGSGRTGIFALYLFCALVVWNLFSGTINIAISSFQSAGGLLTRTYFPPEAPMVAGLVNVLLQAVIEACILMFFMLVVGNVSWTVVIILPIFVLLACFAFGIGLVLAVFNIRYRDVAYLVGILLQVWFYATPIVYEITLIGGAGHTFLQCNPMTHFVYAMRQSIYMLGTPTLINWVVMAISAAVSLVGGWMIFSRLAPRVIEEL